MQETNNKQVEQPETYPLSEEMIQLLSEIDAEMQRLAQQGQGALLLFLRQHKLEGMWNIAENKREVVKRAMPRAIPQ
jgi:hypothetical protein